MENRSWIYSLRSKLLKRIDACSSWLGKRDEATRLNVCRHPEAVQFYQRHGYFSPVQPLACIATPDREHLDIAADFLSKLEEYIPDRPLLELAAHEVLAKIIAYRDLPKGYVLRIPPWGEYVVEKVFDLWNGMPAFGLVGQSPILLFRGTDPTVATKRGVASMITDFDPRGPGYSLYLRAQPQIRLWLQTRPARAIGQSLGGALAAYTVLFESELLHSALPSVAFNPPGFFREAREQWESLRGRAPLITYVAEGDVISRIGKLVGEVRRIASEKPMRPLEAHVALMFLPQI